MSKVGDIKTTFVDNEPKGKINLVDPYGFIWQGDSTEDCNEAILFPLNHFKYMTTFNENATDHEKEHD